MLLCINNVANHDTNGVCGNTAYEETFVGEKLSQFSWFFTQSQIFS